MSDVVDQICTILSSLLPKTVTGQALWQNRGREVVLRVANTEIIVGQESPDAYFARIVVQGEIEAARADVKQGDPYFQQFEGMYKAARRASLQVIATAIEKAVTETEIVGTTTTGPPELPPSPTPLQAEQFFERIKGKWRLAYPSGARETLRIDEDGTCYGPIANISDPVEPLFHLELLRCNSTMDHVEIAKVQPDGRTRQIEVLRVTDDEMTGEVKHTKRRLDYQRI